MATCHQCAGSGMEGSDTITVCRVCKGAGTNGVDLSIDAGREQEIKRALLPERELCLRRVRNGAWCRLNTGHAGDCRNDDAEAQYGPIEAAPPIWRRHKGQIEPEDPKAAPAKAEPPAELIS